MYKWGIRCLQMFCCQREKTRWENNRIVCVGLVKWIGIRFGACQCVCNWTNFFNTSCHLFNLINVASTKWNRSFPRTGCQRQRLSHNTLFLKQTHKFDCLANERDKISVSLKFHQSFYVQETIYIYILGQ